MDILGSHQGYINNWHTCRLNSKIAELAVPGLPQLLTYAFKKPRSAKLSMWGCDERTVLSVCLSQVSYPQRPESSNYQLLPNGTD